MVAHQLGWPGKYCYRNTGKEAGERNPHRGLGDCVRRKKNEDAGEKEEGKDVAEEEDVEEASQDAAEEEEEREDATPLGIPRPQLPPPTFRPQGQNSCWPPSARTQYLYHRSRARNLCCVCVEDCTIR